MSDTPILRTESARGSFGLCDWCGETITGFPDPVTYVIEDLPMRGIRKYHFPCGAARVRAGANWFAERPRTL